MVVVVIVVVIVVAIVVVVIIVKLVVILVVIVTVVVVVVAVVVIVVVVVVVVVVVRAFPYASGQGAGWRMYEDAKNMARAYFRGLRPGKSRPTFRERKGGGWIRRTAPAWGLAQFGREAFCPWRPLEVAEPWQARTFAVAELASNMTLKSYWVQKP